MSRENAEHITATDEISIPKSDLQKESDPHGTKLLKEQLFKYLRHARYQIAAWRKVLNFHCGFSALLACLCRKILIDQT